MTTTRSDAESPTNTSQTKTFQLGDLSNRIHPVFQQRNFQPGLDYTLLEPALRLASRFLSTDAVLPFWHTAFFSKIRKIRNTTLTLDDDPSFEFKDSHDAKLSAAQIKRTKRALTRFAARIKFVSLKSLEGKGGVRFRVVGKLYVIVIPGADLRRLSEVSNTDRDIYTWRSFELATALLRQLAHAVMRNSTGRPAHYFFPHSNVSEHGYDWERSVFGGAIVYVGCTDAMATLHRDILLLPWPGSMLTASQQVHRNVIGLRGRPPPFDRKGELVGHVPFGYVESLFQEGFWERVESKGREAVRPGVVEWRRWWVPRGRRTNV